jgi:hypothetical protein
MIVSNASVRLLLRTKAAALRVEGLLVLLANCDLLTFLVFFPVDPRLEAILEQSDARRMVATREMKRAALKASVR